MTFVRDQVLECVSPTPGLIGGALYVCNGMERVGVGGLRWEWVVVQEAHTGRPAGSYWPFRFKPTGYALVPGTRFVQPS